MIDLDVQLNRNGALLNVKAQLDERITGVFGRSGAGKTTLLHLIAGLITPTSGRITLNGCALFDGNQRINCPPHQRRVAVVFQDARLFPHYTVLGNLRYGGQDRIDDIIDLLDLRPLLDRRPPQLSGGEAQRVALGRALLQTPALLLFDEPLAALDAGLKRQILPYLRRIRDEWDIPMLYVSHDLAEMLSMTEHLLILDRGQAVGCGRFADLVHDHQVLDVVHHLGLTNVLKLKIDRHESELGITYLKTTTHTFAAPLMNSLVGEVVAVGLRPDDIAISLEPVRAISIQNQLQGRITRLIEHKNSALVEVDVGQPLLVRISFKALKDLQLAPGNNICCLIKAHALHVVNG